VCLRSKKLGLEAGLIGLVWDQTGRVWFGSALIVLVWEPASRFGLEAGQIGQRRYGMNGRFKMQGGKNCIFPKAMNANRFF
jgi:hypothetical protein